MDRVTAKFKTVIDAKKRAFWTTRMTFERATQDAARVLRIIIFLHSAKDFQSVLRLYGIEESSVT
jgi:transposase InsO family protein